MVTSPDHKCNEPNAAGCPDNELVVTTCSVNKGVPNHIQFGDVIGRCQSFLLGHCHFKPPVDLIDLSQVAMSHCR